MRRLRAPLALLLVGGAVAGMGVRAWAALSLSLAGGWSRTISGADLAGGPGTDLISTYESAPDAALLTISGTTGPSDAWRIDIKRVDTTWHPSLTLSARRASAGSGGSVSGGSIYQAVTDVGTTLFSGQSDVADIAIQLKLGGVSLKVPSQAYSTTLYYTVVDD